MDKKRLLQKQNNDKKVIEIMIKKYCHHKHKTVVLCRDCENLLVYTFKKIDQCPLGLRKTSCQGCTIHCYSTEQRCNIKKVMRFSGPRLFFSHPFMAMRHLLQVTLFQ